MIEATIAQAFVPVQHSDTVYCPMCEVWHENNGWCQAPASYFDAPNMAMEGHV